MAKQQVSKNPEIMALPQLVLELALSSRQIMAVAQLLSEGNTVPFIARYRKEVHGNLDEVQILKIQERLGYYQELEDRRATILRSIEEQGKLTETLKEKIFGCTVKTVLEDLYLPFKPKRRTRAAMAREKGLEPLAEKILGQGAGHPDEEVGAYINPEKGVADSAAAWAGARDIVAEIISENAEVRGLIRQTFTTVGQVVSEAVEAKTTTPTKFEQYYDFKENVSTIPSHRFLAIRRGQVEGVLRVRLTCEADPLIRRIQILYKLKEASLYAVHLSEAIKDSYKRLIAPSVEIDVMVELKMKSDRAAVEIFAQNLRQLLLQPPLGEKRIIGVDPGFRTGCKCVALDATGQFLETCTIYLAQGERKENEAKAELYRLVAKHRPYAIAVGNGTGGRETEQFVRELLKAAKITDVMIVSVNESGASVYSASEVARDEFSELDLTIRGAISIGRRLQDPLAELVKIDPKAIGVGQYQHDVHQPLLSSTLDEVIVSCVNHVGVELNTASAPLLAHVSGIGETIAKKIVAYRNEKGAFTSRKQISRVPGLGAKTFEQAAGFLRIRGGEHPLDASAVHPERYGLVEKMATEIGVSLVELIGRTELIDKIKIAHYVSENVGELTLRDILAELKKPGRDPRATFEKSAFRDDVTEFSHVKEGMVLEGVVTNVTAFGAFVDIGVHQDGLVHVSELSTRFIREPSEAVKTGERITVRVLSVDVVRKRIALSAKMQSAQNSGRGLSVAPVSKAKAGSRSVARGFATNPFANL